MNRMPQPPGPSRGCTLLEGRRCGNGVGVSLHRHDPRHAILFPVPVRHETADLGHALLGDGDRVEAPLTSPSTAFCSRPASTFIKIVGVTSVLPSLGVRWL